MRVGAKSLTSVGLFAATTAVIGYSGRLRADHLAQLDIWVTAAAGALAVVLGTAVFRFWRLWERSELYFELFVRRGFRFGRQARGRIVELPPLAHRVIYVLVFLWLALLPLDNRAVAQLVDFPRKLSVSSAETCPDPEIAPGETEQDPTQQGCDLILRAYELGYADSLGSCAPDKDDDPPEVCRLRQTDEPYLHYAWRLLVRGGHVRGGRAGAAPASDWRDRFARQTEHLGALVGALRDSIAGAPRASHHLFTNLPDPRPSLRQRVRAGHRGNCLGRYASMPHLADAGDGEAAASRALEHVLGQLLFNPAYQPVVGSCREYTIHWDAPPDACERLARDPAGFLAEEGALAAVQRTLDRRRRGALVRGLTDLYAEAAAGRAEGAPHVDTTDPQRIISFQCLRVDPGGGGDEVVERAVEIGGHALSARERRVKAVAAGPRGQIELAKQVATVLAPGFGYGKLSSHESVTLSDSAPAAEQLDAPDYRFTRLELLRDADVFLGHAWIDERDDLLDVYPYHLHLEHFVTLFRDHYQRQRGRL